ncbi:MAG: hypothetical protein OCC49_17540 [Fibrobacterales bacterium]
MHLRFNSIALKLIVFILFFGLTNSLGLEFKYEAENLAVESVTDGVSFRNFSYPEGSNDLGVIVESDETGDSLTFSFNIAVAGSYDFSVGVKQGDSRGIFQLLLNDQEIGVPIDLYSNSTVHEELSIATIQIEKPGVHTLTFKLIGENKKSGSGWLALDYIVLENEESFTPPSDETGYNLWLRYPKISDTDYLTSAKNVIKAIVFEGSSPILDAAKIELIKGIGGLLGEPITSTASLTTENTIIVGSPSGSELIESLSLTSNLNDLGNEGYLIRTTLVAGKQCIVIASKSDIGALYGVFAFLRLIQSGSSLESLDVSSKPQNSYRLLNHWDNPDGSIERGYAGKSLWKWDELPGTVDQRYTDYARANASIGINGTVLNNVNAEPEILKASNLKKVAALANVFRPYGIRVYVTAQFSAPKTIGGLSTADPTNASVLAWWESKATEIYALIPDFGGFLIKADSEGQPGPHDYNKTHADGANCLAKALAPHGGIVMWRAFVYGGQSSDDYDRASAAYESFKPIDGQFDDNVVIQVKNGPLDFQPREPFTPLFGNMPNTNIGIEFQITQEYLGWSTHMVYLGTLWEEVLRSDTYAKGKGSTIAKLIDGSLFNSKISLIAGVANIGNDSNWCGHHMAQSNWYAFGRMAWDPTLSSQTILDEWISMTFSPKPAVKEALRPILLESHQNYVNYTMPLGLHFLTDGKHYLPGPEKRSGYHQADKNGIGYDRTTSGSNNVSQYHTEVKNNFNDVSQVSEDYLLWFHHVPWSYKMASGNTLIKDIFARYDSYHPSVASYMGALNQVYGEIDQQRYDEIQQKFNTQMIDAKEWRDVCVQYFSNVSGIDYTDDYEPIAPYSFSDESSSSHIGSEIGISSSSAIGISSESISPSSEELNTRSEMSESSTLHYSSNETGTVASIQLTENHNAGISKLITLNAFQKTIPLVPGAKHYSIYSLFGEKLLSSEINGSPIIVPASIPSGVVVVHFK